MIIRTKVEKVISKGYADKLDSSIFVVGDWIYTRRQMVDDLACANFIASVKLAKVLKRLGINSPAQLFKLDPASLARTRGIGEACIFVAMCILDAYDYDVMKWWGIKEKFNTVKHHTLTKARKYKQEVA